MLMEIIFHYRIFLTHLIHDKKFVLVLELWYKERHRRISLNHFQF